MWPLIGGAISGVASLLGGLFGNRARKEQQYWNNIAAVNAANQAANNQAAAFAQQRAMYDQSLAVAQQARNQDIALQREFASSGIQMRVADARAAGIHPVFALGGSGASYSPAGINMPGMPGVPVAPVPQVSAPLDNPLAGLSGMGQDIGRALIATATSQQRDQAFDAATKDLSIQNMTLRNQLLVAQIAKLRGQTGPAMPASAVTGLDPVPEASEYEDRPMLIAGNRRLYTDPGTSNQEDFEKRYGESADLLAPMIAWNDFKRGSHLMQIENLRMRPNMEWVNRLLSGGSMNPVEWWQNRPANWKGHY